MLVAILEETTMGIAIPQPNVELGIAPSLGQWLRSAFMLTMAVVIPVTGLGNGDHDAAADDHRDECGAGALPWPNQGPRGIVMALAPAVGPTVSGVILDSLSWRWIFGLILPIAVIALSIGAKWMLNLGESQYKRIDVASIVLSALGFGGAVFALSQLGSAHGPESTETPTSMVALMLGAVVISLALFVWRQLRLQRREQALMDLQVFRSLNFTMSVVVM